MDRMNKLTALGRLFGIGEGPAEAVAEAKQETMSHGDLDERQHSRLDVLRKVPPTFYQQSQLRVLCTPPRGLTWH
jgi:hypothetical protein